MAKSGLKLPTPIKVLIIGFIVMLSFAIIAGALWLLFELITIMLGKTWVASIVLPSVFLLVLIPIRGWTVAGTIVFMVAVFLSTMLDVPGNPIYNAPLEALFLEEGQYLSAQVHTTHPSQNETVVSGDNIVVDADGNMIYDINNFIPMGYRAVLYTLIYATLLTLRGLIPLPRAKKKTGKRDEKNGNAALEPA